MARGKKFIQFKFPFSKSKIKIDRRTIANILGLLVFGSGLLLGLSYLKQGEFLIRINTILVYTFGPLSFLVPIIVILISSHFFKSKKLQIIKYNITLGMILLYISFIGSFGSGNIGDIIRTNLISDFSLFGAMVILFITFLVGIILFFDTSIDTFVLWMVGLLKNFVEIIKVHVFGSISSSKGKVAKQGEFIEDLSQKATAPVQKVAPASALATQSPSQTEELHMKLFNSEAYKN